MAVENKVLTPKVAKNQQLCTEVLTSSTLRKLWLPSGVTRPGKTLVEPAAPDNLEPCRDLEVMKQFLASLVSRTGFMGHITWTFAVFQCVGLVALGDISGCT